MTPGAAPLDRVVLVKADLTKIPASAIVNAANTELWLGGGVAGAIAREAGPQVETEAMAQGPIEVGKAVVTRAGHLQAKGILYVIHAVTMEPGRPSSPEAVAQATFSALDLATARRFPSIAFPALGTGVGGVSLPDCAMAMLGTIGPYLARNPFPKLVHIACFDDAALAAFRAIHAALQTAPAKGPTAP
ncbi:MAG TPA: macro domain-containing protein [bacterium]|nr:macro domain-containing protein [bacterium]